MIVDQFGQHIDRNTPLQAMMLSPPMLEGVAAAGTDIDIDNSSNSATFAFGGWVYPMDGSADRGHIKAATRVGGVDTYHIDDEYASTIDPPDYTLQTVVNSVSETWDVGDGSFGQGNSTNCINISNGARITKGSGVTATFSMDITIKINVTASPNTCPGGGGVSGITFWSKNYVITVNFSG